MGKSAQVVCSFFADDDAGLRLVKQKSGGGADPRRINTPTTKKEKTRKHQPTNRPAPPGQLTQKRRLAVPYSPTTYQPQYHQRRKA